MRFTTVRGALLALPAVVVMSAMGSASASAATECETNRQKGSEEYTLCVEGRQLGSPTQPTVSFTSKSKASSTLLTFPEEWHTSLVCSESSAPGDFASGSGGIEADKPLFANSKDTLSHCKLEGTLAKKCTILSSIASNGLTGDFEPGAEQMNIKNEGGVVLKVPLFNNGEVVCPVRGEQIVTGHYKCTLSEAGMEKLEHELICESKGKEELVFYYYNNAPATLRYTQVVALGGADAGKKFSIFEST
jgi:hypothetical protein